MDAVAYDVELAARVRDLLTDRDDLAGWTERRMFGGLAFLHEDHLAVAVSGSGGLMVRHDPADGLLERDGVGPVEMRGSPMTGWLVVDPAGLADDAELGRWVDVGAARVRALHPPG